MDFIGRHFVHFLKETMCRNDQGLFMIVFVPKREKSDL